MVVALELPHATTDTLIKAAVSRTPNWRPHAANPPDRDTFIPLVATTSRHRQGSSQSASAVDQTSVAGCWFLPVAPQPVLPFLSRDGKTWRVRPWQAWIR